MWRLVLMWLLLTGMSWYDFDCCNDEDCRPASDGEVVETTDGWLYTPTGRVVKEGDNAYRDSKDEQFHVCTNFTGWLRCLYVPPMGW